MTIPGFTAEASLYRTSEGYRLAAATSSPVEGQLVIPQATRCFRFGACNVVCCEYAEGGEILWCTHYGIPCNISTP
jgi:hypothetical protein